LKAFIEQSFLKFMTLTEKIVEKSNKKCEAQSEEIDKNFNDFEQSFNLFGKSIGEKIENTCKKEENLSVQKIDVNNCHCMVNVETKIERLTNVIYLLKNSVVEEKRNADNNCMPRTLINTLNLRRKP
jgi:hypothetical protein